MASAEFTTHTDNTVWKVENFDSLSVDFVLTPKQLPAFHAKFSTLEPRDEHYWLMLRQLYGIYPVVRSIDADPDFCRAWTRAEYCERVDEETVDLNMGWCRMVWGRCVAIAKSQATVVKKTVVKKKGRPKKPDEDAEEPEATPEPQRLPPSVTLSKLTVDREELLIQHGFTDDYFKHLDRLPAEAEAEKRWVASRLEEIREMMNDSRTYATIINAISNEINLRRINAKMAREEVDSVKYSDLQETKSRVERSTKDQWDQIEAMNPRAARSARKSEVIGTIWDMIKAIRDYHADKNNELIDGFYTAYEIQIQLREAEQHPIRYRLGKTAAILEAIAGLWDPNFKSKFTNFQCLQLDMGFREGCRMAREQTSIALPNLELEGKKGEYDELHDPTPDEPTEVVKIADEKIEEDGGE